MLLSKVLSWDFGVSLAVWTAACVLAWFAYTVLRKPRLRPLRTLLERPYLEEIVWFLLGLALFMMFNNGDYVVYNNYLYQAQAWLQGNIDIPDMPLHLEFITVDGHNYMHFAPGPAILALPFVAIWGLRFNIVWLGIIFGAANLALITRLLRQLGFTSLSQRIWLTAFIGLGCVHLFCAALGWSWFVGHVCTWFFLLAALVCATNPRRTRFGAIAAGLLYGCAVTCRMPMLLSFPLFAYFIAWPNDQGINWKRLLCFCCGAALPGGLYMAFNYARYGSLMDKGYNYTFEKDYPDRTGGPLGLRYVPYNLYSILLMAPSFIHTAPWIIPGQAGVSLTLTTPALYYGLAARSPKEWKRLVPVLWITAVACAIPFLMNYGNGMAQFSMRYAMDFLPFLLLLACLRIRTIWNESGGLVRFWIMLGIWIEGWGILYWNYFYL